MPFFVARLLARLAALNWAAPILVILFVFATSWPLMTWAEPADSDLVSPPNYWWYFVVTAATVGYGDFFPKTGAGHVVGVYVIVGGIVTLTTVFAKLAGVVERTRGRRMQGTLTVTTSGHIVVLGYTPGRTERMIDQLLADADREVVLCAREDTATHPLPHHPVTFVRGELADEALLRRAGVQRARTVLVDVADDNDALAVAVAVDHVNPDLHLVVALRDMERSTLLRYVDNDVHCVQWHTPRMIVEELTSPGIAEVYAELMTQGGADTFSAALPPELGAVRVEHCQTALGRTHGATLLAARTGDELLVSPAWETELPAGSVLYYVGPRRLTADQITSALTRSA
ncbi:NAD-binding protein [Amycolatopsis suaedae]|uniref:Potassium channel protein n=1 Tax=Amycolatopsis suaedae TaxID=2510978 RepID=A0A4Q7J4I8_9PSEU|nr:NAD-binding protein [Amycolatopsis suaedae]RZQ61949.1 potassium channel protein [Amycolatopsis suaedae]